MSTRNPEFSEYQQAANQTACKFGAQTTSALYATVGLAGEVGEVAELIKRETRTGVLVRREALSEELGDVLWYISRIASIYGINMADVARNNIAKIRQRYPAGYEVKADLARQGVTFPELEESYASDKAEENPDQEELMYSAPGTGE